VFKRFSLCRQRVAAAAALAVAFALQGAGVQAELQFRGAEQVGGEPRWSPIKRYSVASDTAYPVALASASRIAPQEVHVFLSGEITRQDVDSAAVMASLVRNGKQKIAGNTVWLASNGGDIDAGMQLGRMLRKLGVYTVIGRNDQCLSACVFAFMGGERRSVSGRLGIHRPYFPITQETADRAARFRHLKAVLKDFVEEMDFPASFYEAVMLVPPEAMQIVAPADLRRFYLEGISPLTEDMVDAASAKRLGLSMFDYLKRKLSAPPCAFFDAAEGRCEGRVLEAAASGSATDAPVNLPGVVASLRAGPEARGRECRARDPCRLRAL
jgi:hypothetical protein